MTSELAVAPLVEVTDRRRSVLGTATLRHLLPVQQGGGGGEVGELLSCPLDKRK